MITKVVDSLAIEGFVVSPLAEEESGRTRLRIEIHEPSGLIQAVCQPRGDADLVLSEEYSIFPGFIDLHVHAREDPTGSQNYKETFRTAGEAAIQGGVTAFADMPNNPLPPVDDRSYCAKKDLAKACPVDVLLLAGIGPGTRPLAFPVPYKVFMGPSIGGLFFESEELLRGTLARYRGLRVCFHAEAPDVLSQYKHAQDHSRRRPPEAEAKAIETAIRLGDDYQIEPHICHLSTRVGLEIIREARRRGAHVTCEVAPHHLYYDQDNLSSFAQPSLLQTNPPIRSRLDRISLLEAFRSGEIDYLATDHAPHTLDEKEKGISGLPQLDTYGAFVCWLKEEGISWRTISEACSRRPGKFLSRYLPQRYGRIEPGAVASLTILRHHEETVRRSALKTRVGWSPFEGVTFPGHVSHTIVRGKIHPRIAD